MAAPSKTFHKSKKSNISDSYAKKRKYDGGYNKNGAAGSYNAKNNNDSSDQSPCNKKRALKAERQSHRKHAPVVRSAKTIWNELRIKTNDKKTNDGLCAELHSLLRGKCMEVAMQHDASRCVQGVLQFGNEAQRREVVTELCSADAGNKARSNDDDKKKNDQKINLAELCKIQYAHFVVLKMIKYCARDEVCVKLIVKVSASCIGRGAWDRYHRGDAKLASPNLFFSRRTNIHNLPVLRYVTRRQSLKKQMTKLAVHSVASRVVELLFATFPPKNTAPLKLELYGPQYALFASSSSSTSAPDRPPMPTLASFVADNPDKREATLVHLQALLQKGLDKSLVGFAYFHSLLHDHASVASPEEVRSFLAPALADHVLHLLSTRHGTLVACECVAYGAAKDRKRMIKCLKGYARSSLLHRDAYLAVLRLCDVMDDTVLVNKMLFAELHQNSSDDSRKGKTVAAERGDDDDAEEKYEEGPSPILDLALSETGSKLFLLLLVPKDDMQSSNEDDDETKSAAASNTPRWQKYFDPYELTALHRNPAVVENGDDAVPTSKKAEETRRQELVVYLKELLVEVCTKHAEELMRSNPGSRVLMEVCESYPSEELFDAVVEACAPKNNDDMDEEAEGGKIITARLPILEDPVGHLTLKHIFLSESRKELDDDDDDGSTLARTFYSKFQNSLGDIACSNRGAFVLSALMQTCVGKEVREALRVHEKNMAKLANGRGKDKKKLAGCGILLELLNKA